MKPSSSPPRARRSARPIAARSTTPRPRRSAATRSRTRLKRAAVDPGEVDDVVMGCALQQGSQGGNVARQALLRAGLPTTVAGMTIDRQCSSGLMAIATAAKEIIDDGMSVTIGGGARIHLAGAERQDEPLSRADPWLVEHRDDVYMTMIETAEIVAERYQVTREAPGRIRAAVAATNRRGAGRGPLRRRDRAVDHRDEGYGQGDRRRLGQAGHPEAGRGHRAPTRPWLALRR